MIVATNENAYIFYNTDIYGTLLPEREADVEVEKEEEDADED